MTPPSVNPPLDKRVVRIFLNVAKVSAFMKHARLCSVGAFHCPHVEAGQDAAKPWRIFMVTEKCIGRDGRRCQHHGQDFSVQLTDEQRVQAIFQMLQLEPFPYDSQPLLDYCIRYVSTLHNLLPHPAPAPRVQESAALPGLPEPHSTRHDSRYRSWVSSLIPSSPSDIAQTRPRRGSFTAEAFTSCSSFTVMTRINNVYCYTKNGQPPVFVRVDAKKRDHMLYVCLRQPAILSAFGLKPRVRHLEQKLEIYDTLGEKWFHSPADTLWLRLNIEEGLILKASGIRITPELEKYVPKHVAKSLYRGSDTLPGFLASARACTNTMPSFFPVPPLTVMAATIPEHDVPHLSASTSHLSPAAIAEGPGIPVSAPSGEGDMSAGKTRATKKRKRNNGAAVSTSAEIIDISSDEELSSTTGTHASKDGNDTPAPSQAPRKRNIGHPSPPKVIVTKPKTSYWKLLPRATKPTLNPEVIVVSDDEASSAVPERPGRASSSRQTHSRVSQPSVTPGTSHQPAQGNRQAIVISDDERPSQAAVDRRRRAAKGKGKMRATRDDDDDSGVDSDATLV